MMDTSDTQLNSVSTPITRMEVMAVMGKGPFPTRIFYLGMTYFHHLNTLIFMFTDTIPRNNTYTVTILSYLENYLIKRYYKFGTIFPYTYNYVSVALIRTSNL